MGFDSLIKMATGIIFDASVSLLPHTFGDLYLVILKIEKTK